MNIVSFTLVGSGEADRWLEPFLKQLVPLVDKIAICLNTDGSKEKALAVKYADLIVEDDREWGKYQNVIKRDFLERVRELKPDWILTMDCDEFLDKRIDRRKLEELAGSPTDIAYQFWCVQLWNDENHWRQDISFENTRFYKLAPEYGLSFERQPLHCGLAPLYAYKYATKTNYIFRHYGLMRFEDRQKKVARYAKYDPKEQYIGKSWYQALRNEKALIKPFEENESFYNLLPPIIHKKKLPQINKMQFKQIYLFRNKHGRVVEAVGEKQRDQILKTKGFSFVQEVRNFVNAEAPVVPAEEPQTSPDLKEEFNQPSPITKPDLKTAKRGRPKKILSDLI